MRKNLREVIAASTTKASERPDSAMSKTLGLVIGVRGEDVDDADDTHDFSALHYCQR
jgi:hypothetical protein